MNIYERIRFLRKEILQKTQEEFAESIKISRSNLGNIETGKVAVTNRVITDICNSFNVNEIWLRTGEGGDDNMFTKISESDRFSLNLGKLGATENEFIRNGVNLLAETDPEKLKILEKFHENVARYQIKRDTSTGASMQSKDKKINFSKYVIVIDFLDLFSNSIPIFFIAHNMYHPFPFCLYPHGRVD